MRERHFTSYLLLISAFAVLLALSLLSNLFSNDWQFVSEKLHTAIMASLVVVSALMSLLIIGRRWPEQSEKIVFPAIGLLAMGLLEGFHTAPGIGERFVLLHSIANLTGGLLFALVWLPEGTSRFLINRKRTFSTVVVLVSFVIGFSILFGSIQLPNMLQNGEFSATATTMNFLAGIFFVFALIRFLTFYERSHETMFFLVAVFALLFAFSSFSFHYSKMWNVSWWFWHLESLVAVLIMAGYIIFDYYRLIRSLDGHIQLQDSMLKKLQRSEERNSSLVNDVLDTSQVGIFILDSTFHVVWVNRALENYFGLSRKSLLGKDKRKLISDEIGSIFEDAKGFAGRVLATYDDNSYVEHFQCHVLPGGARKDRWLEHWSQPIHSGLYAGGRIEHYYDITSLKKAHDQLNKKRDHLNNLVAERTANLAAANEKLQQEIDLRRLAEAELMSMFDSISDPISVQDADHRIFRYNRATENLYGNDIKGKFCYAVYRGENERCRDCPATTSLKTKRPSRTVHRTPESIVEISAYPVLDEKGEVTSVVEHMRDISHKARMEQEMLKLQKLESLGVMAGGIAHDFNNLLQAIEGSVSLAKLHVENKSKAYGLLAQAEQSFDLANSLTKKFITFSRGGSPVKKVTTIDKLLADSVNLTLSGSNVSAELEINDGCSPVHVDEGQLRQAIQNIVINAKEAMADGGVVQVHMEDVFVSDNDDLHLKSGAYCRISIRDHGPGISREILGKIFDPYFSTKQRGFEKGMGLGLTTSYTIVSNHKGHISVESEETKGTTFAIYLPVAQDTTATHESGEEIPESVPVSGKVLVMDDEEVVCVVAEQLLKHLGYNVTVTKDGAEAIEAYKKATAANEPFDVVILDLTVKGKMGGKESMEHLIRFDPSIRAIASSGYIQDPVMTDFESHGFTDTLPKPYKVEALKDVLSRVRRRSS